MTTYPNTAKALGTVLADSYVLYLKTQNYHWNVTGIAFKSLHDLFELQYTDLALAVDEVAERIRTLGQIAPGSFKEYLALTTLTEGDASQDATAMVKDLLASQKQMVASLKQGLSAAQDEGDEVSIGLLTERMAVHEKNAWMLQVSI